MLESATCAVTLGMLDGSAKRGALGKFNPMSTDLRLEPESVGGQAEIIQAERVAFIAYHRTPNERLNPLGPGAEQYQVHVTGKHTFEIEVRNAPSHAIGFRGFPRALDGAYREFFFYNHGVVARERAERLGAMLVRDGRIPAAALDEALATQRAERATPIGKILVEQHALDESEVEEAAVRQRQRKHLRLGEVLIDAGLVTKEDVEKALVEQRRRRGRRLGEVLIAMGFLTEIDLARALAKKFDLPFIDLEKDSFQISAMTEIPRELIAKYGILPISGTSKSLTVAISDPLALDAIDAVRFHAKRRIDEVIATSSQLKVHVAKFLALPEPPMANRGAGVGAILQSIGNAGERALGLQEEEDDDAVDLAPNDGGIVSLVNQIILDAFQRGASDIHLEPNGKERPMTVRFRVDGDCAAYQELPAGVRNQVVARVKIMAKLDISERRKPQDGKIRFRLTARQLELRVATIPTVDGNEDVVLRILAGSKPQPLDKMHLSARNLTELGRILEQPYGLVLCVGPTGSGKTTTLHSALGAINTVDRKIWTAEDPVEITQPGLRQVQVNARIGFTFAQAMRAFLRGDPDVIMVGEMRDHETASTAVEASLTGHLVLSTLHTNSAPETVTRLLDMGLDSFSFADSLLGILAQRLARALCPSCRVNEMASKDEVARLQGVLGEEASSALPSENGTPLVWHARGCDDCGQTGYKGRVPLHELLVTDDGLKHLIARKSSVDEIRALARSNGMTSLMEDGIQKMLRGLTDLKQVLAVCSK